MPDIEALVGVQSLGDLSFAFFFLTWIRGSIADDNGPESMTGVYVLEFMSQKDYRQRFFIYVVRCLSDILQ